jgi:hypothetical protein
MKFIRLGLLTMLVSLFILGACKNPSSIGLEVDPSLALNSKIVDTSTVNAKLFKVDSFVSNYTNRSVLGFFKDPIFGTTTANLAVAFFTPNNNLTFGKNPVLDSAVLVLNFKDFIGDSLSNSFTVEVRQLDDFLYAEPLPRYFNNKSWATKGNIIASKTFNPKYRDSIIIQDIIVGKKDTVKKVIPQLRIRLDPTFITDNILKADSLNLLSSKEFNSYFRGLFLSFKQSDIKQNGGLFSFDTNTTGAAKLELFYKTTSSTNVKDTLSKSFNVNGSSGLAVNQVLWNFSNTPVQTELQSTAKNSNKLYFKGLNGTEAKIDIPYLKQLKSLGSNISINRAELILTVEAGTQIPYKPLPRLRIYKWDIANRPVFLADESPFDGRNFGINLIDGIYNRTSNKYVFNITNHIQDLLIGKSKDYGTFISTTEYGATSNPNLEISNSSNVLNNLRRSVVGGSTSNYKIQLKVYYTDQK